MTQREEYLAAGLKLLPSGRINNFQWVKLTGRLGSRKDGTWIRDKNNRLKGHHFCCGSKRDYYHKITCPVTRKMAEGDYSDLKDL